MAAENPDQQARGSVGVRGRLGMELSLCGHTEPEYGTVLQHPLELK